MKHYFFFFVSRPDGFWAGFVSISAKPDPEFHDRQLEDRFQ
jgi:hypothetical protein